MKVSEEIRSSFDALARKWHVSIHAGIPGGERYTLALYLDRKSLSGELISSEAQMMIKRQKWKGIPVDDDNLLLFFSPWRERDRQTSKWNNTDSLSEQTMQTTQADSQTDSHRVQSSTDSWETKECVSNCTFEAS